VEATRVLVAGEEALRVDNDHTQWVLFAFMAGVRRITPRRAMTANDIIRLVQALVALEPTVRAIEHFRDWLDADGAEGFDVRVHTSFREVFEEIDLEEERELSHAFAMARFEVPRSGDAVYIAARDLDVVAMRREFEMPIEMYVQHASDSAGGLSDDDLKALGARCDDANAWASAEIEAVLALPGLRAAVTPEHMARRVVTRLSGETDDRFLTLLTRLNVKDDPFRQSVARALATDEVGEIIAHQLQLSYDPTVEALGRFLVCSGEGLARTVMHGILGRGTDDADAREAVGMLSEWYGGAQLCEWVVAPALREETATILGASLGRAAFAGAEITRVALAAPLPAGLGLLEGLPPEGLRSMGRALSFMWGRATPELVERLAALLIKSSSPEALRVLADLLLAGKFDAWHVRTLYALCAALVAAGFGRSHVLALALRRGGHEQSRLVAIDCLERDPELVAEALRFRMGLLLESSAVRERLRRLSDKSPKRKEPT
jgi:hypothetical protein